MKQYTFAGHWMFDGISFAANIPTGAILCCDGSMAASIAKKEFGTDIYSIESTVTQRECWTSAHLDMLVAEVWPSLPPLNKNAPIVSYSASHSLEKLAAGSSVKLTANSSTLKILFDDKAVSKQIFEQLGLQLPLSHTLQFTAESITGALHGFHKAVVRKLFASTGSGTFLIPSGENIYAQLVSAGVNAGETIIIEEFVEGLPVNMNGVIFAEGIHLYEPSLQLIGTPECTSLPFGFCGNDYLSARQLPASIVEECKRQMQEIAVFLRETNYRGIFGMDMIITPNGGVVPCEINPRMQSSTALLNWSYRNTAYSPAVLHLAAFDNECAPQPTAQAPQQLFSQIITRTLDNEAGLTVHGNLPEGRYGMNASGELNFISETLNPLTLSENELLITGSPAIGMQIKQHAPLFKIVTPSSVTQDGVTLKHALLKTALPRLKSMLSLGKA